MAHEAEIPRKRAESYLSILEDLLLAFRLPVFQKRAKRQLVQHHNFFYFDVGVYRSLRAFCQLRRPGASHSFWRTRSGLELDFLVYCTDLFWAIEVRRSARIDRRDLAGLKAFGTDYPQAECLLLSMAPEPTLIDAAAGRATRAWQGERVSPA